MNTKETIISIVKENWMLRMLCIFLGIGMMVSGFTSYLLSKKPALVWIVTQEGKITNSKGLFFDWEVEEASRKAVETFYMPSPNRNNLLPSYFSQTLVEYAKKFSPRDRFVSFQVNQVEHANDGIEVRGLLMRSNETDEKLVLKLNKVERTEENPFGLVVNSSVKFEEKKEDKPEGLGIVGSSAPVNLQEKR